MHIEKDAAMSIDGRYRYWLSRSWSNEKKVCWIMLNPSTADAYKDDPTLRRIFNYSCSWGFGGLIVVNLFAIRSVDTHILKNNSRAFCIGPDNNEYIVRNAHREDVGMVVAAWGACKYIRSRDLEVCAMIKRPLMQVGAHHFPRHPLYLKKELKPVIIGSTK